MKNLIKQLLRDINVNILRTNSKFFERQAGLSINGINLGQSISSSEKWLNGNFYSGLFYGDWDGGSWIGKDISKTQSKSADFQGICNTNKDILFRGILDPPIPAKNPNIITNSNITNLKNREEYYDNPPWLDNKKNNVTNPKITRDDEK